ncbi:MAG: hypothetical protein ACOCUY_03235 [Verrucomicrobiota bacterium]
MKSIQTVGIMAVVAASVVFPFREAAGDEPQDAGLARLMKAKMAASGKAGALKQKLTKQHPEALKRYDKIVELREQIDQLNSEIDELLSDKSAKYRHLLREKEQLDRRYNEAKTKSERRAN